MKIGILGSAFDPITYGHLAMAKKVVKERGIDKVIFVPSSENRSDKGRVLTSNEHRLNMLNLALEGETNFEADDIEMKVPEDKHYTYYTLEYFEKKYPNDQIYFIIGADILGDIPKWHKPDKLLEIGNFIVVPRDGLDIRKIIKKDSFLNEYMNKFEPIKTGVNIKISSSLVREKFKGGDYPTELLPSKCVNYILNNNLYDCNKNKEGVNMRKGRQDILDFLRVSPTIEVKEEIKKRVEFLKEYLRRNPGIESLVLGLSGGQDSTLCGKLSQMAVNELNKEEGFDKYKFIGVRLPYGVQRDEDDCRLAIDFIKPDVVFMVNIKPAVDASVKSFNEATGENMSDYLKGNEKARERMKAQYSIAGRYCGLVVGTDHASEAIMGFFTKFGDGAADLLPISNLIKDQGTELLVELGCPPIIYEKEPTADLEDNRPGLPDEVAYGVKYTKIADYLRGKEVEDEFCDIIENTYDKTQHKRSAAITIFDL